MPRIGQKVYDVVVVKRPAGFRPLGSGDAPAQADEIASLARAIPRWAAAAFCRGFNQAEMLCPYGIWAVMRPSYPPATSDGRRRPR
jgi:hypothetical protein